MIETRKVLVIFLASPGDLPAERRYAKECIDEWNQVNADRTQWTVDLVGWEDTLPQSGRPQETINKDVRRSVIFVGMMWKKWGSETGGGFTSGFHEEFTIATEMNAVGGLPKIAMFFKQIPSSDDPGDELKKVLKFKRKIISEHKILFKELSDDPETWKWGFRTNVHRIIFDYIDEYVSSTEEPPIDQPEGSSDPSQTDLISRTGFNRIDLTRLLSEKISQATSENEVPAVTIARLRLLGLNWRRTGLTESYLGVHDANLLYRKMEELDLSFPEFYGLMDSALFHSIELVPLWIWIARADDDIGYLDITALFEQEEAPAASAFTILALTHRRLSDASHERLLSVFAKLKTNIKIAALQYLSAIGNEADLDVVTTEFQKGDSSTSGRAADAAVSILLRSSGARAIKFVSDENAQMSPKVRRRLIERFAQTPDELLFAVMAHRDEVLRLASLKVLSERPTTSVGSLAAFRDDPSPAVRLEALLAGVRRGETVSDDDAQKIIVREKPGQNVFLGAVRNEEGREQFDEWRRVRMQEATDDELVAAMNSFYSPAQYAYESYVGRHFRVQRSRLRSDVSDGFKSYFDNVSASYRTRFGPETADGIIDGFEPLRAFRAREMMSSAIALLSRKGDATDLGLLRTRLEENPNPVTIQTLSLFRKFGEWDDIALLDQTTSKARGVLLYSDNNDLQNVGAETIYELGRERFSDLIKIDLSPGILSKVLLHASKAIFGALSNTELLLLLNSSDSAVRKSTAVKCIDAFSKKRVRMLLDAYLAQGTYFYNVVYWLDAGLYCPPKMLKCAIQSALDAAKG